MMLLRRLWKIANKVATVIGFVTIMSALALFAVIIKARAVRKAEVASQSKLDNMNVGHYPTDTAQTVGYFLGRIKLSYDDYKSVALRRIGDSVDFWPPRAVLYIDLNSNDVTLFLDYVADCSCRSPPLVRLNVVSDGKGAIKANGSIMRRIAKDAYYDLGKEGNDTSITSH